MQAAQVHLDTATRPERGLSSPQPRKLSGDSDAAPTRVRRSIFRELLRTGKSALRSGLLLVALSAAAGQEVVPLPGAQPLTLQGDLSAQMVAGIDRFLQRELERSVAERQKFWHRDFSSAAAYNISVAPNREHLRKIIGAVDPRLPASSLEVVTNSGTPAIIAKTDSFTIKTVRWPVFEGVSGEGLWLQPKAPPVARVIAIPDADQTPEMLVGLAPDLAPERQFARRLAENGCEVLVPVLIDRQDTWSGNEAIHRFTNQPHREWVYRQAFELGRHIIGYEVQKILAAADCFRGEGGSQKIGLAGYGEGGLIALYAAALDMHINAVLVSGYFDSRQRVWEEPIYRNVFGLLTEFGDAEIATLVAPRNLIIEYSRVPEVDGPPHAREDRHGAAPGRLRTPDYEKVEAEFERARALLKGGDPKTLDYFKFITGTEGMTTGPVSDRALAALLDTLGAPARQVKLPGSPAAPDQRTNFDPGERQRRQVQELADYTQKRLPGSEGARADFFWNKIKTSSPDQWKTEAAPFKQMFWGEAIGRFPSPTQPANPRSRLVAQVSPPPAESLAQKAAGAGGTPADTGTTPAPPKSWPAHEVVLDVFPDVFAWGYLLLPKDLKPGERRPTVVCQHGLEGVPADVVTEDQNSQAFRYYKAFAARLAKRGFVVFAPHNPYRGGDKFRQLQRKANPLGKSLFSIIIAQHEQILEWLSGLPFVDAKRIGFYGLSYGGKTAMRVPAVLDRYVLSICSADFNEWVKKNVSTDFPGSYMFTGEYEMPEWDLGHTFNYAEMAALIAPRPFMVERGHHDGVGIDEWVADEYAKVRRFYEQLGIPDRTEIEFFDGPHTINGKGTFDFLHKHLNWPKP